MSDSQRVYSDEEFALILRKATELAGHVEPLGASSAGLTLAEMKAAAAQVGIDPDLVERAARVLAVTTTASMPERLIGGPLRHVHEARFSIELDESQAAKLLSAVRIAEGHAGGANAGHSSPQGMTWHSGGELEALAVTARPDKDGTHVTVVFDRRLTLVPTAAFSAFAVMCSVLAGMGLYEVAPALGVGATIAGTAGALAVARGYWAASTRAVRARIGAVMDTIGQTLTHPKLPASGTVTVKELAPAPERDAPR
jgi:hypothetical protein